MDRDRDKDLTELELEEIEQILLLKDQLSLIDQAFDNLLGHKHQGGFNSGN